MDRRVDVRHFVHRRSCDISSSNMAAYERWPRVNGRGTKYSSEVCRMPPPPVSLFVPFGDFRLSSVSVGKSTLAES